LLQLRVMVKAIKNCWPTCAVPSIKVHRDTSVSLITLLCAFPWSGYVAPRCVVFTISPHFATFESNSGKLKYD
jgi:hypothetical protein